MSEVERNKAMLKEAYDRWHRTKGGSVDHWIGMVADDITFGSLAEGRGPQTAAFTARVGSKEQLRGYFDGLLSGWTMLHYTVDDLVAEGERVVAIGSTAWRNNTTGKVCETPKVDVWRLRDGKAVEFYEYYDTAKLMAAAS
jgi:uncharacterized protein